MNPRLSVGKGVSGAMRYCLGEGRDPKTGKLKELPEGQQSRVEWIGGVNLGFGIETRDDAELARRVMEFDAANQSSKTRQQQPAEIGVIARLAISLVSSIAASSTITTLPLTGPPL